MSIANTLFKVFLVCHYQNGNPSRMSFVNKSQEYEVVFPDYQTKAFKVLYGFSLDSRYWVPESWVTGKMTQHPETGVLRPEKNIEFSISESRYQQSKHTQSNCHIEQILWCLSFAQRCIKHQIMSTSSEILKIKDLQPQYTTF